MHNSMKYFKDYFNYKYFKIFTLVGDHPYLLQTLTKTNINNAED